MLLFRNIARVIGVSTLDTEASHEVLWMSGQKLQNIQVDKILSKRCNSNKFIQQ